MTRRMIVIWALSWAAALASYGIAATLKLPEPFLVGVPVAVSVVVLYLLVRRNQDPEDASDPSAFLRQLGNALALLFLFASAAVSRIFLGSEAPLVIVGVIVPAFLLAEVLIVRGSFRSTDGYSG